MTGSAREQLAKAIDTIEGAYEFFLAYAAQGLTQEVEGSNVVGQFREHLDAMRSAVASLADLLGGLLVEETPAAHGQIQAFREVLAGDAARASAALDLVDAQPFASSQLVDNLNASVHVRTLLTDLFLLDEVLGLGVESVAAEARPA